ncbi:MAG TPA: MFS transporter [Nitrospirota bacterium]|nr:MFS transporter [Nitrospirota bacterium]
MNVQAVASRNPWYFLPTLYFAEGLPYVLINTVSVILYKRMGIDNAHIAFWTSWLYLPWVVKMFWGPFVDVYSTKRRWILSTQFAMSLCLFAVAFSLRTESFFVLSLAAFFAGAFISATCDIATDGFYMLALSERDQALFVGLRAGFYRLAMIFGSGFLVYAAGMLETSTSDIAGSWSAVMAASGLIFAGAAVYHRFVLPLPASDGARTAGDRGDQASFVEVIRSYFRQEKIGVTLAFILFYRLGEAMLLKLVTPFLLDSKQSGGLALSTKEVGLVYGTVGVICLVSGGILGGWLISRFGFKNCVWPMVITMHLPDLFFVYMAYAQPGTALVYPLVAMEQFGYGLGFTVFTVYLMYSANGRYKTSHYAISTGIMALGMMLPGFVSGWIQQAVGYRAFFLIVCAMTIPGMLTIPFLPIGKR